MSLPDPEGGLVVCYEYLWRWQQAQGREDGAKDRPAVIVLARGEGPEVMVVPITSQPVGPERDAIEIPTRVAAHLGLDTSRVSRIVVDEVNMFRWPNDLRRVPGQPSGRFHYGFIPPRLYERVKQAVVRNHRAGNLSSVKRKL